MNKKPAKEPEPKVLPLTAEQVQMIDLTAKQAQDAQSRHELVIAGVLAAAGIEGGQLAGYDPKAKTLSVIVQDG